MPRLTWLVLLAAGPALAQDFTVLEKVAREELEATRTAGAAVAIVRGDQVVFSKGLGAASVETGAPVTPDMLFRLGSTTKMFTAAAVVSLAEDGKLKLDAPVGEYLPGLAPRVARLTAHQLLTHTAGLWDEAVMFGPHDEQALGTGIRTWTDGRLFTEPGRIYSYSNPGYWVAGFLAEQAAGKPYADVVRERLFEPLGMKRSTFRPTMAMTWPLAQGHDAGRAVIRPAADNASGWPAGSMFSSVEDLSRWVMAFLNRRVLPASLYDKMATGHVAVPGSDRRYGYGLGLETRRGVRLVEHGGSRAGYGSWIGMAPEHKVGVIVLINKSGGTLPRTVQKALELMLPLAPRRETPKPALAMTEAEMKRYAGVYSQPGARVELAVREGKLIMKGEAGERAVTRVGELRFSAGAGEFTLVPDQTGGIEFLFRGGRALRRSQ